MNLTGDKKSRIFDGLKLMVAVEEPDVNTGNRRVLLLHFMSTIYSVLLFFCNVCVVYTIIKSLNTKGCI